MSEFNQVLAVSPGLSLESRERLREAARGEGKRFRMLSFHSNPGLGVSLSRALRYAVERLSFEILAVVEISRTTEMKDLSDLIHVCERYDLVIGKGRPDELTLLHRTRERAYSLFNRLFLGTEHLDFRNGIMAMKRDFIEELLHARHGRDLRGPDDILLFAFNTNKRMLVNYSLSSEERFTP